MTLRDQRQEEFADAFINRASKDYRGFSQEHGGILYLCPRFGKCRVAIHVLRTMKDDAKVLVAYPDNKIKKSWVEEFDKMAYTNPNVTFTTHLSLHKYVGERYDLVIIDEIHLLSENQINVVSDIRDEILGLTGTMTEWTERTLGKRLGLNVIARYSIEDAVTEGVVTDYKIYVHTTPLDNKIKQDYGGKLKTEKARFDSYGWVINKKEKVGEQTFHLRLARMRVIQNSVAKLSFTKQLLQKFKNERVLVFCGITRIADSLGIPAYHSKKGEKQVFDDFATGKGNHLAVVKIGNTGVTYKPLNKVVINYFDSNAENLAQKINRCMAMEYNNPEKIAEIHIICSNEDVELRWLDKALEFFDQNKIKYV